MVDFWLPQGTSINSTDASAQQVEQYLLGLDGVTHVAAVIGAGAPRFLLTYTPEKLNSAYTQFLVEVADATKIAGLGDEIQDYLSENFEDGQTQVVEDYAGADPIAILTALDDAPADGILSSDAHFTLVLGGELSVEVTVLASDTDGNFAA